MRDHGRVSTNFWNSPDMRGLPDDGKMLALYLLSSPHSNGIGAYLLDDAYITADLKWDGARVGPALQAVIDVDFARRFADGRHILIVKHFEWNSIENPSVAVALARQASQLPDDPCLAVVLAEMERYGRHFEKGPAKAAIEALRHRVRAFAGTVGGTTAAAENHGVRHGVPGHHEDDQGKSDRHGVGHGAGEGVAHGGGHGGGHNKPKPEPEPEPKPDSRERGFARAREAEPELPIADDEPGLEIPAFLRRFEEKDPAFVALWQVYPHPLNSSIDTAWEEYQALETRPEPERLADAIRYLIDRVAAEDKLRGQNDRYKVCAFDKFLRERRFDVLLGEIDAKGATAAARRTLAAAQQMQIEDRLGELFAPLVAAVGLGVLETWFKDVHVAIDPPSALVGETGVVVFTFTQRFRRDTVAQRYGATVERALAPLDIRFALSEQKAA